MHQQQPPVLSLTSASPSIPLNPATTHTVFASQKVQGGCSPTRISRTEMQDPGQAPFNYFFDCFTLAASCLIFLCEIWETGHPALLSSWLDREDNLQGDVETVYRLLLGPNPAQQLCQLLWSPSSVCGLVSFFIPLYSTFN